jgi:hypothetical protein
MDAPGAQVRRATSASRARPIATERLTWRTGPLNRPGSPEGARSAIGFSRGVGADAEWTSRIASLCR